MPLQLRRGTTAERQSITPLISELIYDTQQNLVYVGNGVTPGGVAIDQDSSPDLALSDLNNVVIDGLSVGEIIKYNGTNWVNSELSFADLSGVEFTNIQTNQLLKWNGTAWVNDVISPTDLPGNFVGDVTGSVFADDSTMMIDGVSGRIVGPVFANVTGNVFGNLVGNVTGNLLGNVTGDVLGDVTAQTITADDIKAGNVLLSESNINLETGNILSISSNELVLDEELFELKIFGETTIEGVTDGITPSLCFNVNAFKEDINGVVASLIEGDFIGGVKFSAFDTVTSDYFTKAFVSARIDTATQNNALPGRIEFIVEDTNGNFSSAASITARGTVDATAFVAKAFANAAARDEALTDTTQPTAVPGTIVFVTDIAGVAKFQGWTGSAWVDLN